MLRELMCLWPRVRGQGWEKAKIHEQLHVPDDIKQNGAPQGSHTALQNEVRPWGPPMPTPVCAPSLSHVL